jgi:hypothetical protein
MRGLPRPLYKVGMVLPEFPQDEGKDPNGQNFQRQTMARRARSLSSSWIPATFSEVPHDDGLFFVL